jgi:hypothetical protein
MQRSQKWLLQSLLYDIFRKCPDLIETTLPSRWHSFYAQASKEDSEEWTRQELLDAFRNLTQDNGSSTAFCIFVDGLDEYEGEHEELVQVIKIFAKNPNVKLCIASRPWNVFEAAFGDDPIRKLYLQDLNRPDIALYVKNKLEDRPDFQKLRWQNPEADELIKELMDKSQGVFLWVFLVV